MCFHAQIVVARDITKDRELQYELERSKQDLETTVQRRTNQLQEALNVKSRFLAIMSHGKAPRDPKRVAIGFTTPLTQSWPLTHYTH